MNSEIKLKSCPFCGQTPEILGDGTHDVFGIHCLHCDYELGYFDTVEEAAEAWNTRKEEYFSQTDAPEQKTTLKKAVCSVVESLERIRKIINCKEKEYLAIYIGYEPHNIFFDIYSENDSWEIPEGFFDSIEQLKASNFSEDEIAAYLKSKIKTPAQMLSEEIAAEESKLAAIVDENKSKIEKLKAKLKEIEERKD